MSRLYNEICAAQVPGTRRALAKMPTVVPTTKTQEVGFEEAYDYEIRAVFKVHVTCRKEDLGITLARARHRVIEDVFGEFRGPIMRVYDKLFQRDVEGAVAALAELELIMFTERTEP